MKKSIIYILKIFYEITLYIYDSFFILKKKEVPNNTVAFVRLDAIGDFIIYISSKNLIPEKYLGMKKIIICNEYVGELAKSLNIFDEVIEINLKKFKFNLFYRKKIIQKIISARIKFILQPTFSRCFSIGDSVVRISCAKERIAFDGDIVNQPKILKNISDSWYTNLLIGEKKIKMERERNHEFIEKISNKKITFKSFNPNVLINLKTIDKSLKNYIVISPGASSKTKNWSVENFRILIIKIIHSYNSKIILCGTTKEKQLIENILKNINSKFVEKRIGRNLLEFIEIIRNADLVIGNDSSAIHIASLVNTKSICIYGGKLYGRFLPYPRNTKNPPTLVHNFECKKCNWSCSKKHNCLNQITVKDVFNTFNKIIKD